MRVDGEAKIGKVRRWREREHSRRGRSKEGLRGRWEPGATCVGAGAGETRRRGQRELLRTINQRGRGPGRAVLVGVHCERLAKPIVEDSRAEPEYRLGSVSKDLPCPIIVEVR